MCFLECISDVAPGREDIPLPYPGYRLVRMEEKMEITDPLTGEIKKTTSPAP
jgi:hypothetical protein